MLFQEIIQILNLKHQGLEKIQQSRVQGFDIYVGLLKKNSIYFHWKVGEQHLYLIDMAIAKGAYVITSEKKYQDQSHSHVIYISSVRAALKQIAIHQRAKFNGEVIAVTGSVGKSSVKNMLAHILQMTRFTLHTVGNENAFLGIFCTLCNINEQTQCIVLETGASGPNSLSMPIQVVKPTVSIILDVNWSHQEKYQNFEALLREKASIIDALVPNGRLIIHQGILQKLKQINYSIRSDVLISSISETPHMVADYQLVAIRLNKTGTNITVQSDRVEKIHLQQSNYANGVNAVYAWAVCKILGMTLQQFNSLIAFYKPLPRRFERIRVCNLKQQVYELIDDAYNASPISTLSLIKSLAMRQAKRKILVLGDMLELGEDSVRLHQKIMQDKSLEQFTQVLVLGNLYQQCQLPAHVLYFDGLDSLIIYIQKMIRSGDLIALKASNGMNFYKIRQTLEKDAIHLVSSTSWFIEDEI